MAQLICVFVFAYTKVMFFHDMAHMADAKVDLSLPGASLNSRFFELVNDKTRIMTIMIRNFALSRLLITRLYQ